MIVSNNRYILVILCILSGLLTTSCTKDITGDLPDYGTSIVVDGSIETGRPPIVMLTRSTKVFGDLNLNDLGSFFVHDARMTISRDGDSTRTFPLIEICLRDFTSIPDSMKRALLNSLGVSVYDSAQVPNVCIYTLALDELSEYYTSGWCINCGEEGHRYDLKIVVNGKTITSYTTIPHALGLNGLSIRPVPGNDSLVNVMASISVPSTLGNFIRYWTKRNDEPFYTAFSGSVYDDKLFAGQTLTLPVERGISGFVNNPDPVTYGYFWRGDTVSVKWTNIDSRTFDFYNTLENDGGGSPFSSPIRVKSNVVGDSAIGVWAGYGARVYTIVVPE